ncbi:conserved hypothetical protein [Candida dubliniensis CD36]|uniref:F-box domain-containing protein n=1 Tax=Candida dubliniensis (strain CD36 / ATCC MYA-646 / CBS 7987 / NCPF 3949 / NRRL Y-17841) TaxID=573826 RepID=B9WHE4_CANDC|nr:conserved hypothetical protein [Candida dubliniensis CD36]CAX41586.1 conserved hypothetical protein [Candida dubliniensis CD36]
MKSMEEESPISILALPYPIIARILYECWKETYKVCSILPMLCTCKQLYYGYKYMLYTLRPLVIINKSTKNTGKDCISCSGFLKLLQDTRIRQKLDTLCLHLFPAMFNNKSVSSIVTNLNQFSNLTHLIIHVKSMEWLVQWIKHFPTTITILKITLVKHVMSSSSSLNTETFSIPEFQLKQLKFQSLVPLQKKKLCYGLSIISTAASTYTPQTIEERYKSNLPLFQTGQVLANLIHANRESLQFMELEMINLNEIYLILQQQYGFNNQCSKYFTTLNLLKVDQCTNYPILQLSHWLRNCKQIIYLNHFLSTFIVLQQNSSSNVIKEFKYHMSLFEYKMQKYKYEIKFN